MGKDRVWSTNRKKYLKLFAVLLVTGMFLLKSPENFKVYGKKYSKEIAEYALSVFSPLLSGERVSGDGEEGSSKKITQILPLLRFGQNRKEEEETGEFDPSYQDYRELVELYDSLLAETHMDTQMDEEREQGILETEEQNEAEDGAIQEENTAGNTEKENEQKTESVQGEEVHKGTLPELPYSMEQLADYDFLIQKVYNVHSSTTAPREVMNAECFLEKSFSLDKEGTEPQTLIYHTHSQETYLSEGAGEDGASVVALGKVLAQKLEERGYHVFHDTSVYDLRDGKLDRNQAYTYALEGVQAILDKYPSIEVVIDLHRDGVAENVHLVSEIDGKPTAQLMFFNGMSQTPEGAISYLENPYREENLAFSFQLQMQAMKSYPGLMRKIFLKGLRYNLHVRPRSLLVEAGAQNNTFEEACNAMEPLADILERILGER